MKPKNDRFRIRATSTFSRNYSIFNYSRIYIFKDSGGVFELDAIECPIVANYIYVAPPSFLHFSADRDCVCIEVDHNGFDSTVDRLLFYLFYNDRTLSPPMSGNIYSYDFFFKLVQRAPLEDEIAHHLQECIIQRLGHTLVKAKVHFNRMGQKTDELLNLLHLDDPVKAAPLLLSNLSEQLGIDNRSLERLCKNVFNTTPKNIVDHRLLVIIFFHLFKTTETLGQIAEKVSYANASNLSRFVYRMIGLTTAQLRTKLLSRGIYEKTGENLFYNPVAK